MRLWSLHPKYLDSRGIVAVWREALLAQAVLAGRTKGYRHHPQLIRFRDSASPPVSIAVYLRGIHTEARSRGYSFDETKILTNGTAELMDVSEGQLDYEWSHLTAKLRARDPSWLSTLGSVECPDSHPLFRVSPGPIAEWEVLHGKRG